LLNNPNTTPIPFEKLQGNPVFLKRMAEISPVQTYMNEIARLEIVQYPTDERETADKENVFFYEGDINEIVAAFHETFSQLHSDRHTDEFEFNWRQPFPAVEFENFESKLKEKRTV